MHTFTTRHRDRSMDNIVSFSRVPMPRGVAFALYYIEKKGGKIDVFSADRTDDTIKEHNRQFGTRLSGQQKLIDDFRAGRGNPANPPNRTSHCYYADATIARLLTRNGTKTDVGDKIPWWAVGLDIADEGRHEDVSRFLRVADKLDLAFRQPYSQGSERHHVILVKSPIKVLEAANIISENRHA